MEIDLGTCPILVMDEATAHQAGEWAQNEALERLSKEWRGKVNHCDSTTKDGHYVSEDGGKTFEWRER